MRSVLTGLAVVLVALAAAPGAQADFATLYGGDVSCAAQPAAGDVRLCAGETTTWDGTTKIDLNVVLPPDPGPGDGPYPLIGLFHGWGGHKIGLEDARVQRLAQRGYAVFSISDRGWGNSCGASDPDRLTPACAAGYNHLMDDRYEVRDAQYLISVLADEGVAEPRRIGATGVSYGGGMSLALAALRDRTMLPDGTLVPWQSPKGKAMELAAAVPQWPWSDLAYSLMPNGATLDYAADSPYLGPDGKARIGVEKASYVSGLFATGLAAGNYAPPGTDPEADLSSWYALINAGEPYDSNPLAAGIVDQITTYHSAYYIDHSQPPAPLLIQSGWNDDLFPVDEAIRFYNRTRAEYPGDPISLFLMDDGHARSQNKPADEALFRQRADAWFDHYLMGAGAEPSSSATALTTVCGGPSEGPFEAANWDALSDGEVSFGGNAPQTILPGAGDPAIGFAFDPIAAGEDPCGTAPGADQAGVANYRLKVPDGGFTLLGSPTVEADLTTTSADSELAARLLDVLPGGEERLVARGLLRPGNGGTGIVFQLHPQAYRFAAGDTVKLELLPSDAPYARASNAQGTITVSNLEVRLPVREQPGSLSGLAQTAAAGGGKPTPALGRATLRGRLRATARATFAALACRGGRCRGSLAIRTGKRKLAAGSYSLPSGNARLRLRLTKAGRKLLRSHRRAGDRRLQVRVALEDAGRGRSLTLKRPLRLGR